MKIAAQISSYTNIHELKNDFIFQCLSELATIEPEFNILFVTDKDFIKPPETVKNIQFLSSSPTKKQTIFRLYWNTYSLPKILMNFGANFFVSNQLINEKKIKTKKIFWADNILDTNSSKRNILSADLIICINQFIAQQVVKIFQVSKEKITVIQPGVDNEIYPIGFDEKEKIKSEHADGSEFFYFDGSTADISTIKKVLQAFSIFKKWQHSSMKMILSSDMKSRKEITTMLNNYKYRQDVIYLNAGQEDKIPVICAASYAAIFFPYKVSLEAGMLNALAGQTAMILPDDEFYRSSFGESALYVKDSIETISEKLILLYKNETERNYLISRACELSEQFNRKNAAIKLAKRIKELN